MNVNLWNENVKDIKDAWPIYIIMFFLTLIICTLFYYLVEHCTTIMIFLMIGGSIIGLALFGVHNWMKYKSILEESTLKEEEANEFKIIAIVCWVLAGIFLILVCCLFSSIKLAAKLISIASDFVNER